jgi:hypothetical protein
MPKIEIRHKMISSIDNYYNSSGKFIISSPSLHNNSNRMQPTVNISFAYAEVSLLNKCSGDLY